ncbi:DNA translocase FtsK (plasmid) [Ralstonia syzygii subsp. celebesensis]
MKGWKNWHDEHANEDPLYEQAKAHVIAERRVSISMVQRHLKIGYSRAAKLIELLEQNGVVSTPDANGLREILIDTEEEEG